VSEFERLIKHSGDAGGWVADWDDVLRRSGQSRLRSHRAAAAAAVAAVAIVLLLPGIGIGGGLNAWISGSRPGFQLRAALTLPSGRDVGTVSLHTSRLFVGMPRRGKPNTFFVPRRHTPTLPPVPLRWSLDLAGGTGAESAVVENRQGHVIARLCAPCRDEAHGTVKIRPRALLQVFGRAVAVVETTSGTARGTLKMTPPAR
jgi:hypothetical protein